MGLFDSLRRSEPTPVASAVNKNSVLIALSESDRTDFGRVDFVDQPHDQQVFSAIWALEGAVNMDGFASYLASEEQSIGFAEQALEAIGAQRAASIVHQALQLSPESSNDMTDEQLEQLEGLDQEFMAYPDDLTGLLYAFVAARPESFGEVPAA